MESKVEAEVVVVLVKSDILQVGQDRSVFLMHVVRCVIVGTQSFEPESRHSRFGVLDLLGVAECYLYIRESAIFEDVSSLLECLHQLLRDSIRFSSNQCSAFSVHLGVKLLVLEFEFSMLFLFFLVDVVTLVVKHLDSFEAVFDLGVHVVDVANHLEFELCLIWVLYLHG